MSKELSIWDQLKAAREGRDAQEQPAEEPEKERGFTINLPVADQLPRPEFTILQPVDNDKLLAEAKEVEQMQETAKMFDTLLHKMSETAQEFNATIRAKEAEELEKAEVSGYSGPERVKVDDNHPGIVIVGESIDGKPLIKEEGDAWGPGTAIYPKADFSEAQLSRIDELAKLHGIPVPVLETPVHTPEPGAKVEEKVLDTGKKEETPGENPDNTGAPRDKVGHKNPPKHTQFGKRPPPDPEKQKKTKADKRATREFMKALVNVSYKFKGESKVRQQLVDAFGEKVLKLTPIELIALQQYQKAILLGDTQAAKFVMEHTYGPVKQVIEHSGIDGEPIRTDNIMTQVIIENPHLKKPQSNE